MRDNRPEEDWNTWRQAPKMYRFTAAYGRRVSDSEKDELMKDPRVNEKMFSECDSSDSS